MDSIDINHLEVIQNNIKASARDSFLNKGITVFYFIALLWVSTMGTIPEVSLIGVPGLFCFWWIDASYLRCEMFFRKLYDVVRLKDETHVSINPRLTVADPPMYKLLFSKTIVWFHLPMIITTAVKGILILGVRYGTP